MKKKGCKKKKGFTLIELLVVIAIIGLLATLAIVSMGSARAKARDAKRISDVKQMSIVIDVEDAANPGSTITGCTGIYNNVNNCTGPGDANFQNKGFIDPSNNATTCNNVPAGTCQYGISTAAGAVNPKTNDYQICFYLENAASGMAAGEKRIGVGGIVNDTCLP